MKLQTPLQGRPSGHLHVKAPYSVIEINHEAWSQTHKTTAGMRQWSAMMMLRCWAADCQRRA